MFSVFNRIVALSVCCICVTTAYAQSTKVVVIPLFGDDNEELVYALGDTGPGGGTVFQVMDGGLHGLEYAPAEDWFQTPWGCSGIDVDGVLNLDVGESNPDLGDGLFPTTQILKECTQENSITGAVHAITYIWPGDARSGGYLPDLLELNLLSSYILSVYDYDTCSDFFLNSPGNCDINIYASTEMEALGASPENSVHATRLRFIPGVPIGAGEIIEDFTSKLSAIPYSAPIRAF